MKQDRIFSPKIFRVGPEWPENQTEAARKLVQKMKGLPHILDFSFKPDYYFHPRQLIVDGFTKNAKKNLFQVYEQRVVLSEITENEIEVLSTSELKLESVTRRFKLFFDPYSSSLMIISNRRDYMIRGGEDPAQLFKFSRSTGKLKKRTKFHTSPFFDPSKHVISELGSWDSSQLGFSKFKKSIFFRKKYEVKYDSRYRQIVICPHNYIVFFVFRDGRFKPWMIQRIKEDEAFYRMKRQEEKANNNPFRGGHDHYDHTFYPTQYPSKICEFAKNITIAIFTFYGVLMVRVLDLRRRKLLKIFYISVYDLIKEAGLKGVLYSEPRGKQNFMTETGISSIFVFPSKNFLVLKLRTGDRRAFSKFKLEDFIQNNKFEALKEKMNSTYYVQKEFESHQIGEDYILTAKDYIKKKLLSINESDRIDLVLLDINTFKTKQVMSRSDDLFRQVVFSFNSLSFRSHIMPLVSKIGKRTMLIQTTQQSFFVDLKSGLLRDGFIHAIGSDKSYLKHFKEDFLYCWVSQQHAFFIRYKIAESGSQEFQAIANIYLREEFGRTPLSYYNFVNIVKKYDSNNLYLFFSTIEGLEFM